MDIHTLEFLWYLVYLVVMAYDFSTRELSTKAYQKGDLFNTKPPDTWDASDTLSAGDLTSIDGVRISWPRVAASCDYKSPAYFGDVIEVRVRVDRHGAKSMTYAFEFWRGDTLLAEGKTTAACCIIHSDRSPEPTEIPEWFTEAVQNQAVDQEEQEE